MQKSESCFFIEFVRDDGIDADDSIEFEKHCNSKQWQEENAKKIVIAIDGSTDSKTYNTDTDSLYTETIFVTIREQKTLVGEELGQEKDDFGNCFFQAIFIAPKVN